MSEIFPSPLEKWGASLEMACGNPNLISFEKGIEKIKIICDCPKCDFSCGWSKKHQRNRTIAFSVKAGEDEQK